MKIEIPPMLHVSVDSKWSDESFSYEYQAELYLGRNFIKSWPIDRYCSDEDCALELAVDLVADKLKELFKDV